MKIGIFCPTHVGLSLRNYTLNLIREFRLRGVEVLCFSEKEDIPTNVDLIWDPRAGRGAPYYRLLKQIKPIVASFHGSAPMSSELSLRECYGGAWKAFTSINRNFIRLMMWRVFQFRLAAIIAVSQYAKYEIGKMLKDSVPVIAIHHGVDLENFCPDELDFESAEPFFLHVSQYQPKKNVRRIIDAFNALNYPNIKLLLVVPGYRGSEISQNVRIIRSPLDHGRLAFLYRRATAFVFPSLHESFGMPILEAMACGCPVITSNRTACPEVAGNGALLVNPRSIDQIEAAMRCILTSKPVRENLRTKGIERARIFTWTNCAQKHLAIFEEIVTKGDKNV